MVNQTTIAHEAMVLRRQEALLLNAQQKCSDDILRMMKQPRSRSTDKWIEWAEAKCNQLEGEMIHLANDRAGMGDTAIVNLSWLKVAS